MNYCLDTNTVIYYLKGIHPGIPERLLHIQPKTVFLPEIVCAELFYGVLRSRQKTRNRDRLEAFIQPFTRLPFDGKASPHYAGIRADLAERGETIGPNDLLIAAIARAHAMILITGNTGEFGRVAGLQLEDWT
ncbi:MAG: type II toxin-antitoxin system VapC family toxin, partial [Opitutales bacterium]